MSAELLEDPIPESIKELLSIFSTDLVSVSFPDISSSVLENHAEQVRAKALELQEMQARVLSAREALEASQNELLQKAVRGLAYAKVYAEDREELSEKLSAISLSGKASSTRKRTTKSENSDSDSEESSTEKKSRSRKPVAIESEEVES